MNNLGWLYVNGRGVAQSDTEAVRCFSAGANARDASAMVSLGWMYENGRGVTQSDIEACGGSVRGLRPSMLVR